VKAILLPPTKKQRKRFNPRAYPAYIRDCVEIDYSYKLTPEEQNWLASFNEAEYGCNPSYLEHITGKKVTPSEMRKVWRDLKRYERDTLGMRPRVDISVYLTQSHANTLWSESVINEFIDANQFDFEALFLENLKFLALVSKKSHSVKRKNYVKTK